MLRQLDHVVLVGTDLDALVADHRRRGFVVKDGGEHAGGLSHNALVGLADGSYIELFAFHDLARARGQHVWADIAERGGGWADFALLSDDLDADAAKLGPLLARPATDGGRVRPDGVQLAWRSARLAAPLPFLIQDVTARDLRVPVAPAHSNGVKGVRSITIGARDPKKVREGYAALRALGAPEVTIRAAERDGLLDVAFA